MAQRYLLTRARTAAAGPLYPGTLLDDALDDVAAIVATGARTYLAPSETIAEAAELCSRLRLRGGTAEQAEAIMLEAAARAQSPSLSRTFVVLTSDFAIAPENPQLWHDVLVGTIEARGGTSIYAEATWSGVDGAISVVNFFRVTIDGIVPSAGGVGVVSGFGVANETEGGSIAAQSGPLAAGTVQVKLQAKNGHAAANQLISASSLPDIHRASLLILEVR